jgi:hypothetical protein
MSPLLLCLPLESLLIYLYLVPFFVFLPFLSFPPSRLVVGEPRFLAANFDGSDCENDDFDYVCDGVGLVHVYRRLPNVTDDRGYQTEWVHWQYLRDDLAMVRGDRRGEFGRTLDIKTIGSDVWVIAGASKARVFSWEQNFQEDGAVDLYGAVLLFKLNKETGKFELHTRIEPDEEMIEMFTEEGWADYGDFDSVEIEFGESVALASNGKKKKKQIYVYNAAPPVLLPYLHVSRSNFCPPGWAVAGTASEQGAALFYKYDADEDVWTFAQMFTRPDTEVSARDCFFCTAVQH